MSSLLKYSPVGPVTIYQKVDTARIQYLQKVHARSTPSKLLKRILAISKNEGIGKNVYNYKADSNGIGRMYCYTDSMQSLSSDCRAFICGEFCRDIDIANCQPTILNNLCKMYNITNDFTQKYCEDRDSILTKYAEELQCSKGEIKGALLKLCYGIGTENLSKTLRTDISKNDYFIKFKEEIKSITIKLKEIPELKEIVDKIYSLKGYKVMDTTILSYILSTFENNILFCMKEFFTKMRNIRVNTLMFDGLIIEHNKQVEDDVLRNCEQFIKINTGFEVKLVDKEMKTSYDYNEQAFIVDSRFTNPSYLIVKKEFEKRFAKICVNPLCFVEYDDNEDKYLERTKTQLEQFQCELKYIETIGTGTSAQTKYLSFLKTWFADPEKRMYDRINFCPNVEDPKLLNLFQGFNAAKLPDEVNADGLLRVKKHIKRLAGLNRESYKWLLKYMKHIVDRPDEKPGISLLFKSDQGTGKNMFWEWFGEKILGNRYVQCESNVMRLFDDHTETLINKLLIIIEESDLNASFKCLQMQKALITCNSHTINPKNIRPYNINSYCRLVQFDNNNSVVIEQNDRRWVVFECDNSKANNTVYFSALKEALDDESVQRAFYNFLCEMPPVTLTELQNTKPRTEIYYETQQLTIPIVYRYFADKYFDYDTTNKKYIHKQGNSIGYVSVTDVYEEYKHYREKYYRGKVDSLNVFGRHLKKIGFKSNRISSGQTYKICPAVFNTFIITNKVVLT